MWTHRSRQLVATTWALLPLYGILGYARCRSFAAEAMHGARRKVLLTLGGAIAVGLLLAAGHPLWALLLAPITLGAASARVVSWVDRQWRVPMIVRRTHSLDGLTPATQTLRELGLDEATAVRIETAGGEFRLAAFDQGNRVRSDVGPIPHFADVQIGPEEFRARARHRLELVVFRGVVCIKKVYGDRASFARELLALDAMAGLPGVPRIVEARYSPPILYQSFLLGRNLGDLMARHGAPVSIQHQVSVSFWGADRWRAEPLSPARDAALRALLASVSPAVVRRIGELLSAIHGRGVTLSDVKYGNVLVVGDQPCFCDFDRATVFRWNTWRCVREREVDRDLFNYCFGGGLLSERAFRVATKDLARTRPDLFAARLYYGAGYASPRTGAWSRGSGRWYLVRSHLPPLRGKTVLDLGCREGLTSLEMLRNGARRVIGYEPDPVMARYARLNHQWFEFVENRVHGELEVLDGSAGAIARRFPDGFDLATAFDGLPGDGPRESAELVRLLSTMAECLFVRASQHGASQGEPAGRQSSVDSLKDLLLTNGYPELEVVSSRGGPPVLIGRRAGRPTPSGVPTPAPV